MQAISSYTQTVGQTYHALGVSLKWLWDTIGFDFFDRLKDASLSFLLRNHQWIYNPRGNLTKIQFAAIRALSSGKEKLYDFQDNLPSLPIPTLEHSLEKYLESVRPLLTEKEFTKTEQLAQEFLSGIGPLLHEKLLQYAEGKKNWLEELWEEMAYLRSRYPLPISTNWYGTDSIRNKEKSQIKRASRLISLAMQYRQKVFDGTLPTTKFGGVVPVCMHPYTRLFGTTRLPGQAVDQLKTTADARHIVVFQNGSAFKVTVIDEEGRPYSEQTLREQFAWIVKNGRKGPDIGILTTQDREQWAVDRTHLRIFNSVNVDCIESALLSLTLSDQEPQSLQELVKDTFKGYRDRWFDKGIQWIVYKNGTFGGNIEHTWADATIAAGMHEEIFQHEEGPVIGKIEEVLPPLQMVWKVSGELKTRLKAAEKAIDPLVRNIDMHVLQFETFGKGWIKKQNMSPDAFIQMAIQLAYYRMHSKTELTYETASTRLFYHGRTETIRSATMASRRFCEGMKRGAEDRVELLREAIKEHVKNKNDSMTGKGCDRHLLALKALAVMEGLEVPFFDDPTFKREFVLATSQTPCPTSYGGGFAPLCESGYGISYHVAAGHINFHITSYHHHRETNTMAFARVLKESMDDMKALVSV